MHNLVTLNCIVKLPFSDDWFLLSDINLFFIFLKERDVLRGECLFLLFSFIYSFCCDLKRAAFWRSFFSTGVLEVYAVGARAKSSVDERLDGGRDVSSAVKTAWHDFSSSFNEFFSTLKRSSNPGVLNIAVSHRSVIGQECQYMSWTMNTSAVSEEKKSISSELWADLGVNG
jgi:hypothetical protein